MAMDSSYIMALVALREQLQSLYTASRNEQRQHEARWEEEKGTLQDLIMALTNTRDIIKGEQKKVHDQLAELQQRMEKSGAVKASSTDHEVDVVDLQGKLIDLNNKVLDIDLELQKMKPMMAALSKQSEERQIHETKLIVLQDTRRILQEEISSIRTEIFRRESSVKYEEDKKRANELGYGDLSHLQEQLAKTEARLDRAKQSLYFPECKGYRFAGGSAGIYFGAKDLYISEISGRFSLACDIATKPDGSTAARLTVALSGASTLPDRIGVSRAGSSSGAAAGGDSPTVRRQPRGNGGDSTPATPTARSLQQQYSAASRAQSGPLASATATSNGSAEEPPHPSSEQQEPHTSEQQPAPGHGLSSQQSLDRQDSQEPVWRNQIDSKQRGAAVMKFFNNLSDKKESLKQVMSQAAAVPGSAAKDMLSGLKKAGEDRVRPEVRAGFSKFTSALAQKKAVLQTKAQQAGHGLHQATRELMQHAPHHVRTATGSASGAALAGAASGGLADVPRPQSAPALARSGSMTPQEELDPSAASSSEQHAMEAPPSPSSSASTLAAPSSTAPSSSSRPSLNLDTTPFPPASTPSSSATLPEAAAAQDTSSAAQVTTRKGVHVTLLAEGVELNGEKGTKVPNVSIKEICLEVEAMMAASFEFSPVLGWQAPERLTFEVIDLERQVLGNSIPLPRTLIKTILNMVLPKVMSKVFLASLPNELGKYVLESDEALIISGEFRMHGPELASFTADLSAALTPPPAGAPAAAAALKKQTSAAALGQLSPAHAHAAAQQAVAALGLSEAATAVLVELFSGRAAMMESQRPCSIAEVCKVYLAHSKSEAWPAMCSLWDAACGAIMSQRGLSMEEPFSFSRFMQGEVARIARKPVRVSFAIDRLGATLEVDSFLGAVRDYFERVARELHASAKGRVDAFLQQPLEEQLENLNLWHQTLVTVLRAFKARFRCAGATLLASADSETFQAGVEGLAYEGPLKVEVPISLIHDSEHFFGVDLKLPDPEEAVNSLAHKTKFVLENVMVAGFGKSVQRTASGVGGPANAAAAAASAAAAAAAAGECADDPMTDETFHTLMESWRNMMAGALDGKGAGSRRTSGAVEPGHGQHTGVLQSPLLGRLTLRKLAFALRLDERRIEEMLTYGGQDSHLVGGLLGCFGNLLSVQLAYSEPFAVPTEGTDDEKARALAAAQAAAAAAGPPQCMLSVQNNDVTRVRVDLESLMVQSCISPEVATRLMHALCMAVAYRLYGWDARQLRTLDAFFMHLHEYTSRDVLDLVAAISVKAECQGEQLRVVLSGDHSAGPGAVAAAVGQQVWPVYFVNDVNLLTVLDTFKLVMDY